MTLAPRPSRQVVDDRARRGGVLRSNGPAPRTPTSPGRGPGDDSVAGRCSPVRPHRLALAVRKTWLLPRGTSVRGHPEGRRFLSAWVQHEPGRGGQQ